MADDTNFKELADDARKEIVKEELDKNGMTVELTKEMFKEIAKEAFRELLAESKQK